MSSENYHEREDVLSEETKNLHRAIVSLKEELDAVDWYQQRAEACSDPELRSVLMHNRNEEIEHAMMVLEWIRRHDRVFDVNIATYLNTAGPIVGIEKQQTGGAESSKGAGSALGIGSLKGGTR
jgi:ferritin-like protein